MNNIRSALGSSTPTVQTLIGTVSGLITGYVTSKIGKPISFAAGTGIIAYQLAQSNGLVKVTWDQLRQKASSKKGDQGGDIFRQVKKFSKTNTPFTAGFIGGFLIGIA